MKFSVKILCTLVLNALDDKVQLVESSYNKFEPDDKYLVCTRTA